MSDSIETLYDILLAAGWHAHRKGIHSIGNESCFVVSSMFDGSGEIPLLQNSHFAQTSKNSYLVGTFGLGDGQLVNYQNALKYFEKAFK